MENGIRVSNGCLQEKNGIWQAVFHLNGKYRWKSTGVRIPNAKPTSRVYRDAENAAVAKIPELRLKLIDELQNPRKKAAKNDRTTGDITLGELLEQWLENGAAEEVRRQTFLTYQQYANKRILPFFKEYYPELKAKDITPWIMQDFVNHLKGSGLKNSSIRKYLVPLRNATAYGLDNQLLKYDPLVNYRYNPKRRSIEEKGASDVRKRQAYSKADCLRLLNAMEEDKDAPVCIAVMLALKLGLRREEILGLRFSDINWEESYMEIRNTVTKVFEVVEEEKTKSAASCRRLYFDASMKEFLWSIKEKREFFKGVLGTEYQDTNHVYVRDDGRQYYPDTVNKQLKKFLKKHKLAPIGLHELRHTYCTFLIASGADIKTVQAAMGHNDSRMTVELYAHIVDEKKKAISGAVDGYLKAS